MDIFSPQSRRGFFATECTKITKVLLYSGHRVIPVQTGIQGSWTTKITKPSHLLALPSSPLSWGG